MLSDLTTYNNNNGYSLLFTMYQPLCSIWLVSFNPHNNLIMCKNYESLSSISENQDLGWGTFLSHIVSSRPCHDSSIASLKNLKPWGEKKKATESLELLPRSSSTDAKNVGSHLPGARAFPDAQIHTISEIDLRTAQHVPLLISK